MDDLHTCNKAFVSLVLRFQFVTLSNDEYSLKVADFGMSHALEDNSDYYRSQGGKIPVKWTAPEVCEG